MANQTLLEFTTKASVDDADWVFLWDTAGAISKKVSRNGLLNSGTLATSAPVTISQTWNDAAVAFTALKVNATSTNSAAASKLLDLQQGTVSKFSVDKNGIVGGSGYYLTTSAIIHFQGKFAGATDGALGSTNGAAWALGGALGWSGTPGNASAAVDTKLERDSSSGNTLALRNGAAAQTFNVYGTYTSITDYKRLSLSCSNTTGNATIGVPFNSVLAVTGGSATATVATVTFAAQGAAFPVGSSVTVAGVTPAGYNATAVVTASTTTSVSYANTVNAAYVSGGTATVSGSASMTLTSAGNVGIGTTSPSSKLQVTGGDVEIETVTSGIIMKAAGTSTRYRITLNATGDALVFTAV